MVRSLFAVGAALPWLLFASMPYASSQSCGDNTECCKDRQDECETDCDESAGCSSGLGKICTQFTTSFACCESWRSEFDGSLSLTSYGECIKSCKTSFSRCNDSAKTIEALNNVEYRCEEITMSGCDIPGQLKLTPYRPDADEEDICDFEVVSNSDIDYSFRSPLDRPAYRGKDRNGREWYMYYGHFRWQSEENVYSSSGDTQWVAFRPTEAECAAYNAPMISFFNRVDNDPFEHPGKREAYCFEYPKEPYADETFNIICSKPAEGITHWRQTHTFAGDSDGDQLGSSVAFSHDGKVIAFSAFPDDGSKAYVRIMKKNSNSGRWSQLGPDLLGNGNSNSDALDVTLAPNVALANTADTTSVAFAFNQGSSDGYVQVYYYHADDEWLPRGGKLQGNNNTSFGYKVVISEDGNTLIVSDPWANNNDGEGIMYRFQDNEQDWVPIGAFNGDDGRRSGLDMGISADGNTVAIGGPPRLSIHTYNATTQDWQTRPEINEGHAVGYRVALSDSGDVLATLRIPRNGDFVQAEVYRYNVSSWALVASSSLVGYQSDNLPYFASRLAMSADGRYLAVGHYNPGVDWGQILTFFIDEEKNRLSQIGFAVGGPVNVGGFGHAVDISPDGKTLVVGAPGESRNGTTVPGYVYIYEYDPEKTYVPGGGGLSVGAIVGIVIGVLLFVGIAGFLAIRCKIPMKFKQYVKERQLTKVSSTTPAAETMPTANLPVGVNSQPAVEKQNTPPCVPLWPQDETPPVGQPTVVGMGGAPPRQNFIVEVGDA